MNSKKLLKIGLALLSAVLLVSAGYFLRGYTDQQARKAAQNTAAQFVSAVSRGNNTSAFNLTGGDLKKNQDQAAFDKSVGGLKTDKPTFETPQVYQSGKTIIYVQKVGGITPSANGRTDAIYTLNVTKEGGKWKVTAAAVR